MSTIQKTASSSSAHSASSAPVEVKVSKLTQFVSSLKIIGDSVINGTVIYYFTDNEPVAVDAVPRRYSSKDLAGMGIAVVPVATCRADLNYDSGSTSVYCF